MRQKLVEGGVPEQKVKYIPHFLKLEEYNPTYRYDDYFFYLGRLSDEKGLMTLIRAMKDIKRSTLKIIGDGPQGPALEKFAVENNISNVEFVGKKSGNELKSLVANALFMVIPSEWYENAPMVIYEAFAMAKPVIGADIGGISELIQPGINGWLYKTGDVKGLQNHINYYLDNREEIPKFGREARKLVDKNFTADVYYDRIMKIYGH
jgi:glycosyltransferase involved in cell wall biosynthesis